MSDEDEFIFEEDDDCEEEPEWEIEVENLHANAENNMDKNPQAALRDFLQVVEDDQEKGKWTYSAYQGLYKTCLLHVTREPEQYEAKMCDYYRKMLTWNYSGRRFVDVDQSINQMIERAQRLPTAVQRKLYNITVEEISKDIKTFDKLWFKVKYKIATLSLQEGNHDVLMEEICGLHEWCTEGERAFERKSTQLLNVYALEIQLYTEKEDPKRIRQIYQAADDIKSAIPDPRVLGVLRESGGKMYMRQAMWTEAYDCMFAAFRSYEEASDPRKIGCLKYLVVTKMLADADINPFDTNEAKAYQQHPDIVAVTQLLDACESRDLKTFDRVMKDKHNQKSLSEDKFLASYLDPLIRKLRMQVLRLICKPYKTIAISYVAQELMIPTDEAENLVISAILDNHLQGAIDETKGLIVLSSNDDAGGDGGAAAGGKKGKKEADAAATQQRKDRYQILRILAEKEAALHTAVAARSYGQ